jgi:hypothetical protein
MTATQGDAATVDAEADAGAAAPDDSTGTIQTETENLTGASFSPEFRSTDVDVKPTLQ